MFSKTMRGKRAGRFHTSERRYEDGGLRLSEVGGRGKRGPVVDRWTNVEKKRTDQVVVTGAPRERKAHMPFVLNGKERKGGGGIRGAARIKDVT